MASDTVSARHGGSDPVWNSQYPRLHVGTQRFTTSDEHLAFLARHGVKGMSVSDLTFYRDRGWDAGELADKRAKCARYGIDMEMVELPIRNLNQDGGAWTRATRCLTSFATLENETRST